MDLHGSKSTNRRRLLFVGAVCVGSIASTIGSAWLVFRGFRFDPFVGPVRYVSWPDSAPGWPAPFVQVSGHPWLRWKDYWAKRPSDDRWHRLEDVECGFPFRCMTAR